MYGILIPGKHPYGPNHDLSLSLYGDAMVCTVFCVPYPIAWSYKMLTHMHLLEEDHQCMCTLYAFIMALMYWLSSSCRVTYWSQSQPGTEIGRYVYMYVCVCGTNIIICLSLPSNYNFYGQIVGYGMSVGYIASRWSRPHRAHTPQGPHTAVSMSESSMPALHTWAWCLHIVLDCAYA